MACSLTLYLIKIYWLIFCFHSVCTTGTFENQSQNIWHWSNKAMLFYSYYMPSGKKNKIKQTNKRKNPKQTINHKPKSLLKPALPPRIAFSRTDLGNYFPGSLETFCWPEQGINAKEMCKEKKWRFTLHNEVIGVHANIVSDWFLVLGFAGLETAWNYWFYKWKKKRKEENAMTLYYFITGTFCCNDSLLSINIFATTNSGHNPAKFCRARSVTSAQLHTSWAKGCPLKPRREITSSRKR